MVGGGREGTDWVDRELKNVTGRTVKPWGIGFLSWAAEVETVERALAYAPSAVMLSFGDPEPFATVTATDDVPTFDPDEL